MTKKFFHLIFDFDGVILNSNKVKTNAFKSISKQFGNDYSEKLVAYHLKNGGISRFKKIGWFVNEVLEKDDHNLIMQLINSYGIEVKKALYKCELRTDLFELKNKLDQTLWSIASGGLEDEILCFLKEKNLLKLFEAGVYGSPTPKLEIIKKIKSIPLRSAKIDWIVIGDSIYDFKCAKENGINFIFASDWSDIKNPDYFLKENDIPSILGIEELNLSFLENLN
tara:strand:- start:2294 stop:2965 length:672 start_codon:yes stop_codon:yes gene_type:complete